MIHYLLFDIAVSGHCCIVIQCTCKSCLQQSAATYQILLLVLTLAFSHLVVVSTLQMIIHQNLTVLIFCDNNHEHNVCAPVDQQVHTLLTKGQQNPNKNSCTLSSELVIRKNVITQFQHTVLYQVILQDKRRDDL